MRGAFLALIVTVVIVVGLLQYKTSSAPQSLKIAVGAPQPGATAAPQATAAPSPGSTAASSGQSGTYTGPAESNQFGNVQVQITVANGKLTGVKTLQLPYDHTQSAYISSVAGPLLIQEAKSAQSANIDNVSGASYTSYSFALSLQAALSQAGM